jgi:hypothetical protein
MKIGDRVKILVKDDHFRTPAYCPDTGRIVEICENQLRRRRGDMPTGDMYLVEPYPHNPDYQTYYYEKGEIELVEYRLPKELFEIC